MGQLEDREALITALEFLTDHFQHHAVVVTVANLNEEADGIDAGAAVYHISNAPSAKTMWALLQHLVDQRGGGEGFMVDVH
jgi:hypothetical protein